MDGEACRHLLLDGILGELAVLRGQWIRRNLLRAL
jgi:hypothetical protein